MVNYTHPQPEERKNPAYDAIRKREFSYGNKYYKQRKQVQQNPHWPYGCVIVNKYIKKLFCSKRSFHSGLDLILFEKILFELIIY
jgi:hypothetical protein